MLNLNTAMEEYKDKPLPNEGSNPISIKNSKETEDIAPAQQPVDFHKRNLLYIEEIKRKKEEDALLMQKEAEKEKEAKQKLSILILKRAEKVRKQKEEAEHKDIVDSHSEDIQSDIKTEKDDKENKDEPDSQEKSQLKGYYRSRHATFLKALSNQNKQKKEKEEEDKRKKEIIHEKLKETLGVSNVQSKFLSSIQKSENEDTKECDQEKTDKKSEDKAHKTDKPKDAALSIAQRQIEYIKQLSNKRNEEKLLKKEEELQKEKALVKSSQKFQVHSLSEVSLTEKSNKPKKSFFFSGVTDMTEWKKKAKLPDTTKVFVITGGYGDIKKALKSRGWVENRDVNSDCFDLKWTLKIKEINYKTLKDSQIVNHFIKNTELTTKVGLCRNLRNLIWYNSVDIDTFYPRCFDMSDPNEVDDFSEEFKFLQAESILKKFVKNNYSYVNLGEERVMVSLNVCEKRVIDLDDYLDKGVSDDMVLVTKDEWELMSNNQMTSEALAQKKHEKWYIKLAKKLKLKVPKKKKKELSKEDEKQLSDEKLIQVEDNIKLRVNSVLQELEDKYPQFSINGLNNIWIVKPASLSRGRGIGVFSDFLEILDYTKGKEQQWICQKYIENPMIILNRKFDIRQWVLVTSFCPLKAWFYNKCYLRFGGEDYTKDNLENKYVHLTNNSVVKHCHTSAQTNYIEGNMWYSEDLQKFLLDKFGSDVYEEKIVPQMKNIIKWSLQCVQEQVIQKKSCCEHFGYDFMIDEKCNVWLIEVNSSPAMDYSTCITEDMVKEVSDDIVKVLVDYRKAPKGHKSKVDTGNFTQICKGKSILEKPLHSYGISLVCEGKKIK